MRSMHKFLMQCVTATVAVTLAIPAMPQEPAGQGPVIKSQVSLVNLFATVRDKNKKIMANLKQEDFKISEDNQDQKIAFFSKEVALPITLALLLDTSGSEQDMLSAIQEAGSGFIRHVDPALSNGALQLGALVREIRQEIDVGIEGHDQRLVALANHAPDKPAPRFLNSTEHVLLAA